MIYTARSNGQDTASRPTDSICSLGRLHFLWLGNNRLRSLPKGFGQLRSLDWGRQGQHTPSAVLDGNPMERPPMDVCKRGVDAIAKYFGSTANNSPANSRRRR